MKKIIAIVALFFSIASNAVEIENFKSGLACTDGETFGWICHEVETVYVTGQSKCVYNDEAVPCTWHGFEFDYKDLKEGQSIECRLSSSLPRTYGSPDEVIDKNVNKTVYKLDIEGESGHFFNPQYVNLVTVDNSTNIEHEHTECYVGDKTLFEFKKSYVYPESPE